MRNVVCLLTVLACIAVSATGDIYSVDPEGGGDFPTIQAAVDACIDGDTIELADGTFSGEGNWDVCIYDKAITIRSASLDPSQCILNCADASSSHIGFRIADTVGAAPHVLLDGITVRHAVLTAVLCYGPVSIVIDRCVFYRNEGDGDCGGGITVGVDADAEIKRCTFVENYVNASGTSALSI